MTRSPQYSRFFFFNDPATTEIYTLCLHDALPIYPEEEQEPVVVDQVRHGLSLGGSSETAFAAREVIDRERTRLNSSHSQISYAVFCLQKDKRPTPNVQR